MQTERVIQKCKNLPIGTEFRCKVLSGAKATTIMFELLEHFVGEGQIVSEHKLGRYLVSVQTKQYDNLYCFYDYQTKTFSFQNVAIPSETIVSWNKPKKVEPKKVEPIKVKEVNLQDCVIRQELSSRGGGIEISLDKFGFKGHKMAAYQNYLGGGMLGSIQCNDTIRHANNTHAEIMYSNETEVLDDIAEQLKRYMHSLTNHDDDEYESASYEENQKRSARAY